MSKSGEVTAVTRILYRASALSLVLLTTYVLSGLAQPPGPTPAPTPTPTPTLVIPGEPIERDVRGGQRNVFRLDCTEGNLIRLTAEQKGIDIAVRFFGPQNAAVLDFDFDPRSDGEESVDYVCPVTGASVFYVDARQRGVDPGKFIVRLLENRPANEKERALDEGRRLLVTATQAWRAAKYKEALDAAEKCLAIRLRELGPADPEVGLALFTVGNIYSDIPEVDKAYEYYHRAISNLSEALGADHVSIAGIYNNYGVLLKAHGRYPEALTKLNQALSIRQRTIAPGHLLIASVLNNIASVHRARGDEDRAHGIYSQVLVIREKALGPDHPEVATAINNVVDPRWDLERSEPMYLRALAIREAKLRPDHPDIAQSRYNLAAVYAKAGQYDRADPFASSAVESFRRTLGPSHPFVGAAVNLRALIANGLGRMEEAERLVEEAISIKERAEGSLHPNLGGTFANAAGIFSARGKTDKALHALARSNTIYDYNIRLNLASGSESEKLKYVEALALIGDLALTLTFEKKDSSGPFAKLAFESVLQRKGRVLDAMSDTLGSLRTRLEPKDAKLLDEWKNTNARIATLVLAGPGDVPLETFKERILQLENERDRAERALSHHVDPLLSNSPASVDILAEKIPNDSVLVEFTVYRPVLGSGLQYAEGAALVAGHALEKPRYAAFILNNKGQTTAIDLGPAEVIEKEIGNYRSALRNPYSKGIKVQASELGSRVFGPIRRAIAGADQILLSPDGDLNLVPFEALADEQMRYLVESFSFTYLSSGRDLLKAGRSNRNLEQPVIVADPEFGPPAPGRGRPGGSRSVTSARDFSETYFAPLTFTAQEAKAITALFPDVKVLSGANARETDLKKMRPPAFLHIATHGFFVQNPLGMMGGAAGGAVDMVPAIARRNPLLRSGLALAGANNRLSGDDDGILTALEVTGLDLRGSKLVVLSACDTGVGEVRTGEGVFGLRRAFQLAGAESLVMSLWPVSDHVTKELMAGYYRNLKQGLGRGESLRQIQLSMLAKPTRKHPFYWASFIQAGEWTPLVNMR